MKVLFFCEAITFTHIVRPLKIAKHLESQYECIIASTFFPSVLTEDLKSFKTIKIQDGFQPDLFVENITKGKNSYTKSVLERYIEEDCRIISEVKPDLIIGDFRHSLAISSQLTNTVYLNLVNINWSPYSLEKLVIGEHVVSKICGGYIGSLLLHNLQEIVFQKFFSPMNSILKKHKLAKFKSLYEMYTAGNAVAYLDHKGLFKTSKLPSHHNIVGPITFSTKVDMPIWINKIKESSKPCVLVTMGSSGDLDYLTTIIDSLVELPINIIVATMGKMLLNYSHDNLYCVDYLPIEDIAPLCSMFLTNGGSPMSYIGLRAGVPTIGFPVNLDQATSFTAIANNKLGIRMRSSELKKGKIQSAVTEILNDEEYKANCEKIAIEMQGYSTLVNIEKIVSGLLKKSNV